MNTIDFEAFAVGKWNGMTFDRAAIDEIAANFTALEEVHKVPLKFGHNNEQPMTDGYPALGWVTKAWVNDDGKLMLRAERVPDVVKKAIEQKLYRKVSVELDIDVEHKGKKYRYVLSGVALLGADLPAVNTLADLDKYLGKPALAASRRSTFSAIEGRVTKEEFTMDEKAIQAMIDKAVAPLAGQVKDLSTENERLKSENAEFKRKAEESDRAGKAEKVRMAREKLVDILERAVKQSVISPGQRELFRKNFGVDDDARVTSINVEDFTTMISGGKKIDMSTGDDKAKGGGTVTVDRVFENPDEEINRRVNMALASSGGKLTYSAALGMVLEADPKLGAEYIGQAA